MCYVLDVLDCVSDEMDAKIDEFKIQFQINKIHYLWNKTTIIAYIFSIRHLDYNI